ncbi:PepSY-associated TM helix domain-containing protein [Parasphingorhabdus cellanae]|uniref:PepSY domain-containing protein n=1 Tax=Parasphingorhabdus cellanae TaxID=2806553 RepID=A0ABX7T8Q5_9SPHN|nr:PepSY-associated TM helix domain-containing protein [Parasphingorhabdus cellanae]QTD56882.1 PepSY domain-containing protein [Parasphingorhabdus cellanae]
MAQRSSLRKINATLHAWVGALCAIFIILVTISGMAIAFSGPLMHLETGAFPKIEAISTAADPDLAAMVAAARTEAGETFLPLGYLGPHAEIATDIPMIYGMSAPPDAGGEVQIVSINPGTNEAITNFYLDRTWTHLLIDFHYELLAGDIGEVIVAVLGLILSILAFVGIYLWWPVRRGFWMKAKRFSLKGNWNSKSFSLHSFFGFWCALLIVIWGLTGTYWSKPDWGPAIIKPQTDILPEAVVERMENATCDGTVSIGQATGLALATYPGTRILEAEFAAPWQPYHILYLSKLDDLDKRDGDRRVWVSSSCANMVHKEQVLGLGKLGAINNAIHSGDTFGAMRQPVILIVGLTLLLLSITGLIVWFKRYFRGNPG